MTSRALVITLLLWSVFLLAMAGGQPFESSLKGTLPSGKQFELNIREVPYERTAESAADDDGSYWGIDGGYPSYVVKVFTLVVNKKKVDIPRKALWDICNVLSAEVLEREGNIVVRIQGGDAAGAYSAEFLIRVYKLSERIVRGAEMPEEAWERTRFHYPD